MAVNNAWNIGWWNQNANRNYPISSDVSRIDLTNSFTLPNEFIVDFGWTYTSELDVSSFYIYSVAITSKSVIIVLGYDGVVAGKAVINVSTFQRDSTYLVSGTGIHYDSVGTITIGSLNNLLDSGITIVYFPVVNTKLEASTFRQLIRGVTTLKASGGELALTGDLIIDVDSNIRVDQLSTGDITYLTLNVINTSNMLADCVDCGDDFKDKRQITSINGIVPDIDGNIDILGDPCLSITSIANGLQFTDLCSQPCCGCEELAVIKNDFAFMRNEVDSINTVSRNIAGELTALSMNLISSQTDDISTDVATMIDLMQALLDEALSLTDCNPPC